MSFNRLVFLSVILGCILTANPDPAAIPLLLLYWGASVLVFIHILFDNGVRTGRRLLMMTTDIVFLSYVMHGNGAYAAAFFPTYLWVIFGNGFRFGLPYLFASAAISVVAFGLVIMTTPFWRELQSLSIGLLIGLIILPAYAGGLIRKLSKAKREAEEASRAKSYFLASVSHELRTPLTAIIGLGAHLHESDLPADQKNMAGTITTAGRSLLSLINQLLDFSRLGAKGISIDSRPFDLMALLVSVRELMKVGAEDKGLRIALHVSSRTPLMLEGDESHLRDVLVNLVGNAIKFTERGVVTISADLDPSPDGATKLLLAVSDTGIGIEPEAQAHIFENFTQADTTIIDRFGGTGLGLAICKQVAELLGGEIGVESTPGLGSRFWFTSRITVSEGAAEGDDQREKRLILFSNDDRTVEMVASIAGGSGIALVAASSLDEVGTLTHDIQPNRSNVVLIDSAELARQALHAEAICEVLGHDVHPVLLQSAEDKEGEDRSLDRIFISTVTAQSDVADLSRSFAIATAAGPNFVARGDQDRVPLARRPLRILVADDNLMNQKVFAMILGRAGHIVEIANDGEAALDIMKDHSLDIVLMDVNMPVLNGIEATKLYRFTALGRRRVPIIGITADASPETSERCLEAGMDTCVPKPVEAAPLLRLIDELVNDNAAPSVAAFDPSGVVTPLFAREDDTPAINWAKLAELEDLGGAEFVADLLNQYLKDAEEMLALLTESVASGNLDGFRDITHALRSSGANIGADKVAKMCLQYQRIARSEFNAKGAQYVAALQAELVRVRKRLAGRNRRAAAAVGG